MVGSEFWGDLERQSLYFEIHLQFNGWYTAAQLYAAYTRPYLAWNFPLQFPCQGIPFFRKSTPSWCKKENRAPSDAGVSQCEAGAAAKAMRE